MKKKITSALLLLAFIGMQAQSIDPAEKINADQKVKSHKKMVNMNTKDQRWFIPTWNLLDDFYQGSVDGAVSHYANVIFPDSTVKYLSGGESWTWLHSMGIVVDPYAGWYGQSGGLVIPDDGSVTSISLDSLFVLGWYNNVDGVFGDTLVFEVVVDTATTGPAFDSVFNSTTGAAFSDPKMLGSTTHTGWHAKLTDPNKYTIKHVLTPDDSTMANGKYITIPVDQYVPGGINVNPGEIVGINVTFVPGYSYNFGDTIFSYDAATPTAFKNTMRYGFYGTDDANANPDLFLDPYNDQQHFNGTYLIMTEGRYGLYSSTSPLNEAMYPYTNWGLDAGAFFDWQVGVESNQQAMEMSIYPNPAADQVTITVEDYNNATVEVYNLLGEVVKAEQVSDRNTKINVADLNNGTYIVRVMNGEKVATKKVVINK